ncbi:MAG: hypothetical protein JW798_10235 [Prolixibacteraceae bacterium]|nr:hypothetical protein [Prolixibacteraceae bacterium]
METIIRIKTSELTPDFIKKIKALFKNDDALEISITPISDFGLSKIETREEYEKRINKAIRNLEKKEDVIAFTSQEFNSLSNDLIKK